MYRPYTKEDKLEVGTKIRLAGREGKIVEDISELHTHDTWRVMFGGYDSVEEVALIEYPLLEIEDIPLPPLKIDKRVKEELINRFGKEFPSCAKDNEFVDYLNSLEEC